MGVRIVAAVVAAHIGWCLVVGELFVRHLRGAVEEFHVVPVEPDVALFGLRW
ncbi:hypothetical protein [Streptomyces sp. WL006]|uniref:hypothetical protein n=1 Tax=Streptomyces sp. WL006 TaxID=3423915 RepID=UPI003F6AD73F